MEFVPKLMETCWFSHQDDFVPPRIINRPASSATSGYLLVLSTTFYLSYWERSQDLPQLSAVHLEVLEMDKMLMPAHKLEQVMGQEMCLQHRQYLTLMQALIPCIFQFLTGKPRYALDTLTSSSF